MFAPPKKKREGRNPQLVKMEAENAAKEQVVLDKVQQLKDIDKQVAEAPASIPEDVATNMVTRMVPFVGIPMTLAVGSFGFFYYMARFKDQVYPTILVATVTVGFLAVGLLGITYSLFSTNWDGSDTPSEGLGVVEFNKNIGNVKQGLSRARENAMLRDKMDEMENEENVELKDLNRRMRRDQDSKK